MQSSSFMKCTHTHIHTENTRRLLSKLQSACAVWCVMFSPHMAYIHLHIDQIIHLLNLLFIKRGTDNNKKNYVWRIVCSNSSFHSCMYSGTMYSRYNMSLLLFSFSSYFCWSYFGLYSEFIGLNRAFGWIYFWVVCCWCMSAIVVSMPNIGITYTNLNRQIVVTWNYYWQLNWNVHSTYANFRWTCERDEMKRKHNFWVFVCFISFLFSFCCCILISIESHRFISVNWS